MIPNELEKTLARMKRLAPVGPGERLRIVRVLFLLTLAVFGVEGPEAEAFLPVLVVGFFVWPKLQDEALGWFVLTVLLGYHLLFVAYYPADNHKWLCLYWAAALTVVHMAPGMDRERLLAQLGRAHIVLIMGLGALWKILSNDYLDGDFFTVTLTTEERFRPSLLLAGVDTTILDDNVAVMRTLTSTSSIPGNEGILRTSPRLEALAFVLTWWGMLIELITAVLFAVGRRWTDRWAHAALLTFIFTTYTAAPVPMFGWLLGMLGLAVCPPRAPWLRLAYLAGFAAVTGYELLRHLVLL